MAIQITQDPINQFMDNLPQYALDLRRQDEQKRQFNANLDLRLKAEARAQEIYDINKTRAEMRSDIFESRYEAQRINRENKANLNEFIKDNAELYDDWSDYQKNTQALTDSGIPGSNIIAGFRQKSFEDFLTMKDRERPGIGSKFLSIPFPSQDTTPYGDLRDEFVDLNEKAIAIERPKAIDFNDYPDVILDESLISYAFENQALNMRNNELIDDISGAFGYPGPYDPYSQTTGTQRSR